jgi:hypothetical protein
LFSEKGKSQGGTRSHLRFGSNGYKQL